MSRTWVVVANSACAKILQAEKPAGELREIRVFEHPEGRMHERELTSDLPGRAFDSGGEGRHAMSSPVEPHRQAVIRFAALLAEALEKGREQGAFDTLHIVAAPAFLGEMRKHLSVSLARMVQSIDKDVTALGEAEIRALLPQYL